MFAVGMLTVRKVLAANFPVFLPCFKDEDYRPYISKVIYCSSTRVSVLTTTYCISFACQVKVRNTKMAGFGIRRSRSNHLHVTWLAMVHDKDKTKLSL